MARFATELRTVIPQVADELDRFLVELVDWVGVGIEANASADAPIGPTGKLANGIEKRPTTISGTVVETEVVSTAEYSAYVDMGTGQLGAASEVPGRTEEVRYSAGWRGMAARPFFSSAVENGRIELDRGARKLENELPRL